MSKLLSGLHFCCAYLGDRLVYSTSWKEHLGIVFNCLKLAKLEIRLSKCHFTHHLHYLGHLISKQDIQPLPEKLISITNLKESNSMDQLCHFLGSNGYYMRFVSLFTEITKPLNKLLRKGANFQWSAECQSAFEHLKKALCTRPILQYPSTQKPYIPFTDANNYAHSGILTQAVNDPDDLRPITYTLGSFSDMQQRSSTSEKVLILYQSVLNSTCT